MPMNLTTKTEKQLRDEAFANRTPREWVALFDTIAPGSANAFADFRDDEIDRVFAWLKANNKPIEGYRPVFKSDFDLSPLGMINAYPFTEDVLEKSFWRKLSDRILPRLEPVSFPAELHRGHEKLIREHAATALSTLARHNGVDDQTRYIGILVIVMPPLLAMALVNNLLNHSARDIFNAVLDGVPLNLISQHLTHGIDASILNSMMDAA